ncbi:hypothetical protein K2X33_05700 [bacterium]|nr:hypothetical protein [bacterium]
MKYLSTALLFIVLATPGVVADDVYRIEISPEGRDSSAREMNRRIRQLERAVSQLQQRVFDLETTPSVTIQAPAKKEKSWICTVKAMGETYTGTGTTKAIAAEKSLEKCSKGRGGDTFFCKDPKCEE